MRLLVCVVAALAAALACAEAAAEAAFEEVGAYLFATPKIARDAALSCASCHVPALAWQDGYERGLARRIVLSRNTPTLLNASRYELYFWDGRARGLQAQVHGPLFARAELHSSDELLAAAVKECAAAAAAWKATSLPIRDFATQALAAFVRSVARGESRFEAFLAGRATLSPAEAEGHALFTGELGCASCHRLPHLTDNAFHDIGLPRRKLILQTTSTAESQRLPQRVHFSLGHDFGRANVSDRKQDLHAFRTPSLFHVTKTAPYMHDGIFHSLPEVLDFYSRRRVAAGLPSIDARQQASLLALFEAFSDFPPAVAPASACPPPTKPSTGEREP